MLITLPSVYETDTLPLSYNALIPVESIVIVYSGLVTFIAVLYCRVVVLTYPGGKDESLFDRNGNQAGPLPNRDRVDRLHLDFVTQPASESAQ